MATPMAAPHATTRMKLANLVVLMARAAPLLRGWPPSPSARARLNLVLDLDLAGFLEDQGSLHCQADHGQRFEIHGHCVGRARLKLDRLSRLRIAPHDMP